MHVNEVALYIKGQPSSELCGVADLPAAVAENTDKRYTRAWNFRNVVENCGAKPYEDYITMLEEIKPDVAYLLCESHFSAQGLCRACESDGGRSARIRVLSATMTLRPLIGSRRRFPVSTIARKVTDLPNSTAFTVRYSDFLESPRKRPPCTVATPASAAIMAKIKMDALFSYVLSSGRWMRLKRE